MMEVFFLGTGTAVPVKHHAPAGLLVVAARQLILLDIGPGTLTRLEAAGFSCSQLHHLLLTHFHPDHTLDLATLLQVFNFAPGAERRLPFTITACPGIEDFYRRMLELYPDLSPLSYELKLIQVFQDAFSIDGLNLRCAPTGHTPESIAFRLDDGRHSLVYSGDASSHGELVQLADGADMLVCECSFPAGWVTEDHLNADSAGLIAQQARVKSLVLTHTYPPAQAVNLVAQVRSHYSGAVRLAVDGLHLTVED
jgi:ribonuclease BN (tRNA processing enzyme)